MMESARISRILISAILVLFSVLAQAQDVSPTYFYRSYVAQPHYDNPDPQVHLQMFIAENNSMYESCMNRIAGLGYGTCRKIEVLRFEPSQQTSNGRPTRYITRNKVTTITLQSSGYYTAPPEYDVFNLVVDLKSFCPEGSIQKGGFSDFSCKCTSEQCSALSSNGPESPQACPSANKGNPISVATGNKFQHETDYVAASPGGIEFARSYNSSSGLWLHSYADHLRMDGTYDITLVTSGGRESYFKDNGTALVKNDTERGNLIRTTSGFAYTTDDNQRYSFDTTGQLTGIVRANGLELVISRTSNTIHVDDGLGNTLDFTEDARHQPLTLTSPTLSIAYTYNANGQLESVSKNLGGVTTSRQFHYEDTRDAKLLTGITDEQGVRFATWAYDDNKRAILSEHANGAERITLAFNADGSTSYFNEYGKKAVYRFRLIDGVKYISAIEGEPTPNCPASNSRFGYDASGLLTTKTDAKGNLTSYTYNSRRLEISRTEAWGTPQARTITTEWHPTLLMKTKVTEPSRITTYQYDAQGRPLGQTVTPR